jgi:BirA family biotin operon repressor/biotin-[acetyl-CoA-carboxylase] ligase
MNDSLAALVLRTRWLGRVHEHHAVLGSTNDRASAWAKDGAPAGALVTADAQTGGRGRLGRGWFSPAGASVYASVVVRPAVLDARWAGLGLAVGVGIADGLALEGLALKWPNDVLLDGRKLAGVLCEARVHAGAPDVVVGFGINVHAIDRPPEIAAIATSLAEHGATLGRADVLARVLDALEPVLDVFAEHGFAALRDRYESRCITLGREVLVGDGAAAPRRRMFAVGLDGDGALRVRDPKGGPTERIEAGDVTLAT